MEFITELLNPKTYGLDTASFAIILMVGSAVAYKLQAMLLILWTWAKTRIYVEVSVGHLDETFAHLNTWADNNLKHSIFPLRNFTPESRHSHTDRAETLAVNCSAVARRPVFGAGTVLLRVPGYPLCLVQKTLDTASASSPNDIWASTQYSDRPGTITIRFLGLSPKPIQKLFDEAHQTYYSNERYAVYDKILESTTWCKITLETRSWDSVILPVEQKARILANVEKFFSKDMEDLYKRVDVPYRRGMLLSGPPGTGKSSLIKALRFKTNHRLFLMNISGIYSDNDLLSAFRRVAVGSIVVIEDIDTVNASMQARDTSTKGLSDTAAASRTRSNHQDDENDAFREGGKATQIAQMGVTLGGLLNALDGVATPQGIYVIMTTNHPDKLDKALIRDGRIDLHEIISPLDAVHQSKLFCRIMEIDYHPFFKEESALPASTIQGACLRALLVNTDDKNAAIDSALIELGISTDVNGIKIA